MAQLREKGSQVLLHLEAAMIRAHSNQLCGVRTAARLSANDLDSLLANKISRQRRTAVNSGPWPSLRQTVAAVGDHYRPGDKRGRLVGEE